MYQTSPRYLSRWWVRWLWLWWVCLVVVRRTFLNKFAAISSETDCRVPFFFIRRIVKKLQRRWRSSGNKNNKNNNNKRVKSLSGQIRWVCHSMRHNTITQLYLLLPQIVPMLMLSVIIITVTISMLRSTKMQVWMIWKRCGKPWQPSTKWSI